MMKNNQRNTFLVAILLLASVFVSCEKDDAISTEILAPIGEEQNHTWVEMGLSVRWSTYNVGANTPYENGDYFAWGEIEPKEEGDYSYKWGGSTSGFTKYGVEGTDGVIDNKTTLEALDDAATMNWGGNWRMPTAAEWEELLAMCNWEMVTTNGVEGYQVTSKQNGNIIFIPATSPIGNGAYCAYWSSSLNTGSYGRGRGLSLHFGGWSGLFICPDSPRDERFSVRPVCPTTFEIRTLSVSQVTENSAIASGYVVDDNSSKIIEAGIVCSLEKEPTISDYKVVANEVSGLYTCTLNGLEEGKKYYMRAYVNYNNKIYYGAESYFFTLSFENNIECIDLGLSVKWATMNVGASSPEDCGDYFAWGETEPKSTYNWSTYTWCNGSSSTLTKYNYSSYCGIVDNKTQLDLTDDAAHVNWGGAWRMPTDAEMTELLEQCTWTWTTQNGVNGYKVTSKGNGNSIFLPAAGYCYDSSLSGTGSYGYYWSSSLDTDYYPNNAWRVYFYSYDRGWNDFCYRNNGLSVRPVCPQNKVQSVRCKGRRLLAGKSTPEIKISRGSRKSARAEQ